MPEAPESNPTYFKSAAQPIAVRRALFALLVGLTVWLLSWAIWSMLHINGLNAIKLSIFVIFVILLIPIALSFWTAAIGLVIELRGRDALNLARTLEAQPPQPAVLPRTAVVMPTYNEDPVRVFAGLKATCASLDETGYVPEFEFFILSDTTDPNVWIREELAFTDLRNEVPHPETIFYRNRRENLERKSGNIADFCATWGERYRYMIVMDADSVMTGESLFNLVRLMEANPGVGIIQAPPLPVNSRTLFGRLHQFAARAYNSVFINGLDFWQGGTANYWGHNAIIRIRPFVEHCRLPKLSGPEPLGGSILSHDFVEAALMRRAGWKVYLASNLHGTYEELPPSLITYAMRDRRWCQGNLQHLRLLFTPGLHWVSRIHLLMGVMAYVSAPLWMLVLVLSTIESLYETLRKHPYFPSEQALFPTWPISVQHRSTLLFVIVIALLLLPKCFSLVACLRDRERAAAFGGRLKLSISVLLEILFSSLIAPVLASERTRFVIGTFMGRNVKWNAQQRDDMHTTIRDALRRHGGITLLGLVWAGVFLYAAPKLIWWFSPVLIGLILAIPVSVWSSRSAAGTWAKRHGLWLIPEEISAPKVLSHLQEELAKAKARRWSDPCDGLTWVMQEPDILELHLGFLQPADAPVDPLIQHRLAGLQLKLQYHGAQALTTVEKRELLLDAEVVRSLKLYSPAAQEFDLSSGTTTGPINRAG